MECNHLIAYFSQILFVYTQILFQPDIRSLNTYQILFLLLVFYSMGGSNDYIFEKP